MLGLLASLLFVALLKSLPRVIDILRGKETSLLKYYSVGFFQHLEHLFLHWLILFAYEVGNGAIYWASTQIRDTYPKVFRKLIYLLAIECCAARHSYSVLWLCFDAAAAAVISSMQKWNHKIKSLYATRTEWVLLWYAKLSLARKKWIGILETVPFDICKESYSTANESKWQFNRSITYYLNVVPIVNDSFWMLKYKKVKKKNQKCTAEARTRAVWASHWSLML